MKVAVLSESPADDAAVRILVEGLLGEKTEHVPLPSPKARGWYTVLNSVRPALTHLHYHIDAYALVLTLDSDETPVHRREHEQPDNADAKCRLCKLRAKEAEVQSQLRAREGRGPIKVALGLAVPAIEAWWLVGRDPHVTEATWIEALQTRKFPYTRNDLKQQLYGTEKPQLSLEEKYMAEQAGRLVQEQKIDLLEKYFPGGFGTLADDVRGW